MYTLLTALGITYLTLALVVYFFQHFFFFRPEILPDSFVFDYPFGFEEKTFEMEDGGRINSLHFRVPNSRGVVLYCKGNSRSIKGWSKFAIQFLSNGFDFFVMDYRGFGKSRGKRTESRLYSDTQQMYRYLNGFYPEETIVVYGRSLGSGIATRIASWNRPACLILDSPYYSFYHHVRRYAFILPLRLLLRYQIRTDQFIRQVQAPIYIIHGTKDRLIPISDSKRLRALAPHAIQLIEVAGAGHNNLPDYPEFHELLYTILDQIAHGKTHS